MDCPVTGFDCVTCDWGCALVQKQKTAPQRPECYNEVVENIQNAHDNGYGDEVDALSPLSLAENMCEGTTFETNASVEDIALAVEMYRYQPSHEDR